MQSYVESSSLLGELVAALTEAAGSLAFFRPDAAIGDTRQARVWNERLARYDELIERAKAAP